MAWNLTKDFGGKAANQAVAQSKLNAESEILSKVGNDENGNAAKVNLRNFGVNCDHVIRSIKPTGHATILLDSVKENIIIGIFSQRIKIVNSEANNDYPSPFKIPEIWKPVIEACNYLIIQNEVQYDFNRELTVFAYNHDTRIYANFWNPAVFKDEEFLQCMFCFVPNKPEFSSMIGLGDDWNMDTISYETIAKKEHIFGKDTKFIITLGAEGCMWYEQGKLIKSRGVHIQNPAIETDYQVVDTVGAGDSFMAGFCRIHVKYDWETMNPDAYNENINNCMQFANICGFLCCTQKGAQKSPTLEEVMEFQRKYDL